MGIIQFFILSLIVSIYLGICGLLAGRLLKRFKGKPEATNQSP
ncbi:MAG TPA: hypothetical protein VNO14_00330 [Blastocatellia bacterium]|nr:hypothetical protein [Blastocatellia bacterium]